MAWLSCQSMDSKRQKTATASLSKQQVGCRLESDLIKQTKILAIHQQRRWNDLVEEALRDLLKKYKKGKG